MSPATLALLRDCLAHLRATMALFETEAEQRPERRTAHLAEQAKALVERLEEATSMEGTE